MNMKITKKSFKVFLVLIIALAMFRFSTKNAYAWRSTQTRRVNVYTLYAKADLPYWTDFSGGGNWKAQAVYSGSKNNNRLTLSWSFYSIGGSVSASGVGMSGSGTSKGGSYTATGSTVYASGRVYGHGLSLYVGMYSTASFSKGNSYYSITTKI